MTCDISILTCQIGSLAAVSVKHLIEKSGAKEILRRLHGSWDILDIVILDGSLIGGELPQATRTWHRKRCSQQMRLTIFGGIFFLVLFLPRLLVGIDSQVV